jgi:hypothetical protein
MQMEWIVECRSAACEEYWEQLEMRKEAVQIQSSIGTNSSEMRGDRETRALPASQDP